MPMTPSPISWEFLRSIFPSDMSSINDRYLTKLHEMIPTMDEGACRTIEDDIGTCEKMIDVICCPISYDTVKDIGIDAFGFALDGHIYSIKSFKSYVDNVPTHLPLRSPLTREPLQHSRLRNIDPRMKNIMNYLLQSFHTARLRVSINDNRISLLSSKCVIFNPPDETIISPEISPSIHYKLRNVMLESIYQILSNCRVSATVFGGLVRRHLALSIGMSKTSPNIIGRGEVVDIGKILEPGWDIDIHMDHQSGDLNSIISALSSNFSVTVRNQIPNYTQFQGGLTVAKLCIQPKSSDLIRIFGIKLKDQRIMMDVVMGTRKMVDFTVNACEYKIGGARHITIPQSLLPVREETGLDGFMMNHRLITNIMDEISNRTCRMIVYDEPFVLSTYSFDDRSPRQSRQIMNTYHSRLFWRLHKMIKDGWVVTNILPNIIIRDDMLVIEECGQLIDVKLGEISEPRLVRSDDTMSLKCNCGQSHEFIDLHPIKDYI